MAGLENRADRLAQIRAQVAYHGQRLALHQRLHGSSPCSRLSELEHAYNVARERLAEEAGEQASRRVTTR